MPLLVTVRLKNLREEIATLRKAIVLSRHVKGHEAAAERERQLQRLEEIREELRSLMDGTSSNYRIE